MGKLENIDLGLLMDRDGIERLAAGSVLLATLRSIIFNVSSSAGKVLIENLGSQPKTTFPSSEEVKFGKPPKIVNKLQSQRQGVRRKSATYSMP